MFSLQAILLLSIGITHAVAWTPNCSTCEYVNDVGYVKSDEFCGVYYKCIRNSIGSYYWYVQCCRVFMTFDVEALTCLVDLSCDDSREKCPKEDDPIISLDCPPNLVGTVCADGMEWSQDKCSCIRSANFNVLPCDKILHFDFTDSYDSDSCNNFASGVPHGKPPPALVDKTLSLNGIDQYLAIPFLNNWFLRNAVSRSFTLCFWLRPDVPDQTAFLFTTNCFDDVQGVTAEISLVNGQLVVGTGVDSFVVNAFPPTTNMSKVCLTRSGGKFTVFYNGQKEGTILVSSLPAQNPNQNYAVLGAKHTAGSLSLFQGRFDDFCLYTRALADPEILTCFNDGPSN